MHHDRDRTLRRDPVAGQAGPLPMPAVGGVRAGPMTKGAAPSGAGPRGPAGQSASSAPLRFPGRCGVSPLEGAAGDRLWLRRRGRPSPNNAAFTPVLFSSSGELLPKPQRLTEDTQACQHKSRGENGHLSARSSDLTCVECVDGIKHSVSCRLIGPARYLQKMTAVSGHKNGGRAEQFTRIAWFAQTDPEPGALRVRQIDQIERTLGNRLHRKSRCCLNVDCRNVDRCKARSRGFSDGQASRETDLRQPDEGRSGRRNNEKAQAAPQTECAVPTVLCRK